MTDNDDFEPNLDLKPKIVKGKWEGEDEDDDVKVVFKISIYGGDLMLVLSC